ncbi:MAG: YesL family protein, partial [Eubacteriales bacterium]|nr:YesL family protein [Eubacteriales bacterium]
MKERFRQLRMGFQNTLSFLGDIVILNLLFFICSLPIVTIGAAATACYAGVSRTLQKKETGLVFREFFADFRAAFRQATAGWLLQIGAFLILAGDIWFAVVYSEPSNKFFLIFAIVVGAGILLASLWFYPLVARFQNKLKVQLKNAFLLAFAQFPRTLFALLLWVCTLGLPLFVFEVLTYYG